MLNRVLIGFGLVFALSQLACAHSVSSRGLFRGTDREPASLSEIARELPRGGILVLGEQHALTIHRDQQVQVLEALRAAGHRVSVGLEFLLYPSQESVDAWRRGEFTEEEFLKRVEWKGFPFEFYRTQALFPNLSEGSKTLAMNIPGFVTSKVAKSGLDSLTPAEAALVPPNFQAGRDSYRRRFESMMPHLPPGGDAQNRYFLAQSLWDDTVAWKAAEFISAHPEQTLVIIMGDFHVRYGGGLVDRLRARTQAPIRSLSQVNSFEMTPEELEVELQPSLEQDPRADWIWVEEGRDPETRP